MPNMLKNNRKWILGVLIVLGAGFSLNSLLQRNWGLKALRLSPPERAFYYWRTQWDPEPSALESLVQNKINTLYIRLFDVEWDGETQSTRPVSPLELKQELPKNLKIIPVVYITNEVFIKLPYNKVYELYERVSGKVNAMMSAMNLPLTQLQIDCDWSDGSRKSYFNFLKLLKDKLNSEKKTLSSTLRLHQIKYPQRTGVPPVNRGMLMFYNFGKIEADSDKSSIFNSEDASKYSKYISNYRLPLDISLPIFSWVVHSRDGKIVSLLDKVSSDELLAIDGVKRIDELRFEATRSFFFHGKFFAKGDLLLLEHTGPSETKQAADLAIRGADWKKTYQTVAMFDLDEGNLRHYGKNEIENIFKQF